MLVRKEEGFRALYKGIVPKVMRLGPGKLSLFVGLYFGPDVDLIPIFKFEIKGGAIMIIAYEEVYKLLRQNF